MKDTQGREQHVFKVVCAWCGDVIRFRQSKNSQGMCTKCYTQMLHEYNRAHMQTSAASER